MRVATLLIIAQPVLGWQGWQPPKIATTTPFSPQQGKFTPSTGKQYQMPVTFGETVELPQQAMNSDVEVIEASYQTDPAALLPFLPKQVELRSAEVTVSFKRFRGVPWLAGRGYHQITLTVPVRFTAADGTVTEGAFAPVVWSDSPEVIQAGREAVNLPFVYANISFNADQVTAAWDYTTFVTLKHFTQTAVDAAPQSTRSNLLGWGYLPSAVGSVATASISQLTSLPSDTAFTTLTEGSQCALTWTKPVPAAGEPAPGYNAMPTEFRIVNTIADLPVRSAVQCTVRHGSETLRYDLASVLYDDMVPKSNAATAGSNRGHFEALPETMYAMPITFGGWHEQKVGPAYYPDGINLFIQYETDPEALLKYVPSGLKLTNPQITVSFARSYNVGWLAGRSYDMIDVGIPVAYTLPNGTEVEASWNLVVWENCWEGCLLTGREMSGVPKIWADTVYSNETAGGNATKKTMRAAWGGTQFLHLSATVPPPTPLPPANMTMGHGFQWKYFPSPNNMSRPEISELTDYPVSSRTKSYAAGFDCEVQWLPEHPTPLTSNEAPTQHRVINALAAMPVKGTPNCGLAHSESILQNGMSSVIDGHFMQQ